MLDAAEESLKSKAETLKEFNIFSDKIRLHATEANEAHSKAEEKSANEIQRLKDELNAVRKAAEDRAHRHDEIVSKQLVAASAAQEGFDSQIATLRQLVVQLEDSFATHREAAEKERSRLAAEVERLDKERRDVVASSAKSEGK